MFLKKLDSDHNLLMLFDSPVMQDGCIQITESEYKQLEEELDILANGTHSYRGMIKKQEQFRDFRSRHFAAFDIYKSNIDYGIIEETEEERQEIISWYMLMLEFPGYITEDNYETIEFPETPAAIRSYLDGGSSEAAKTVTLTKTATSLKTAALNKQVIL